MHIYFQRHNRIYYKVFMLLLSHLLIETGLKAQTIFQRNFFPLTTTLKDVMEIPGDGYYFCGYNNSFNGSDLLLIKTDTLGNIIWNRVLFEQGNSNNGWRMVLNDRNEIVVSGAILLNISTAKIFIYVLDLNGNLIDQKTYEGLNKVQAMELAEFDQKYMISGFTYDYNLDLRNGLLMSVDTNLAALWIREYYHTDEILFTSILTIGDDFIVTGFMQDPNINKPDCFSLKADAFGNIIWAKRYISNVGFAGRLYKSILDYDNNILLVGNIIENSGIQNAFVIKIDSHGNVIWNKVFNSSVNTSIDNINYSNDSGFVFTVQVGCRTILTDSLFNIISAVKISPGFFINGLDKVIPVSDGGYLGCGATNGTLDGLIIKFDSNLNPGCNFINFSPSVYSIILNTIDQVILDSNRVFLTNANSQISSLSINNGLLCSTATNIFESDNQNINIYPNPFVDIIFMEIPANENVTSIQVVDLFNNRQNPKFISDQTFASQYQIDLKDLSTGIYTLLITLKSGRSIVKRIIKS